MKECQKSIISNQVSGYPSRILGIHILNRLKEYQKTILELGINIHIIHKSFDPTKKMHFT